MKKKKTMRKTVLISAIVGLAFLFLAILFYIIGAASPAIQPYMQNLNNIMMWLTRLIQKPGSAEYQTGSVGNSIIVYLGIFGTLILAVAWIIIVSVRHAKKTYNTSVGFLVTHIILAVLTFLAGFVFCGFFVIYLVKIFGQYNLAYEALVPFFGYIFSILAVLGFVACFVFNIVIKPVKVRKVAGQAQPVVVGYDQFGNPIYGQPQPMYGQAQPQQAVVGYDQFGNPIYGQPQPQQNPYGQPQANPYLTQTVNKDQINQAAAQQAPAQGNPYLNNPYLTQTVNKDQINQAAGNPQANPYLTQTINRDQVNQAAQTNPYLTQTVNKNQINQAAAQQAPVSDSLDDFYEIPDEEPAKPAPEKKETKPASEKKEAKPVAKKEAKAAPKKETKPAAKKEATKPVKATKPAAKKEAKPVDDGPKVYHVTFRQELNKWEVKAEGADKAVKLFDTQREAIDHADALVVANGGDVKVHRLDGKVRPHQIHNK